MSVLNCCELLVPLRAIALVLQLLGAVGLGSDKVVHIVVALDDRKVWRLHLEPVMGVPRETFVPLVLLDIRRAAGQHGQSVRRIVLAQGLDEVLHELRKSFWEFLTLEALLDHCVHLHWVVGLEWDGAIHELVDEDAEGPPIHSAGVPCARDGLWGEVLRRPATSVRLPEHLLGQTHVCDFQPPLLRYQQVLRLQVSVDHLLGVHVLDASHGSSDVEPAMFLAAVEALAVVRRVQLAAQRRLHEEKHVLWPVVGLVAPDDEGGVQHEQDPLLVDDVFLHFAG
mmetsp:Transcript_90699/g.261362  ORF Transcript_90699/g.261362 Transcript_90699/m.261362 type:complete len:282 (-) Transcript_90699:1884-2729(-)